MAECKGQTAEKRRQPLRWQRAVARSQYAEGTRKIEERIGRREDGKEQRTNCTGQNWLRLRAEDIGEMTRGILQRAEGTWQTKIWHRA